MRFPIDHDLHCHTRLSLCSLDDAQMPETILAFAKAHGYTTQCVTDHLWDEAVPCESSFYRPQNIPHVSQSLPLPKDEQVRMVFGCETEYCGGDRLALSPQNYDKFDFIVIPPNHYHFKGLVRPRECDSEEKIALLLLSRLEELSRLDLPWRKVGIAHITVNLVFAEGDQYKVYRLVDGKRFYEVMKRFASLGAGIEINLSCFKDDWREHEEDVLRLYRLAAEAGCKFYLASDAHHPDEMKVVPERAPCVLEKLGLTKEEQFVLA